MTRNYANTALERDVERAGQQRGDLRVLVWDAESTAVRAMGRARAHRAVQGTFTCTTVVRSLVGPTPKQEGGVRQHLNVQVKD
jgi:hypothetical protein